MRTFLKNKKKIFIGLLTFCALFSAHAVYAASLSITAPSTDVTAGDIVTVKVLVSADGVSINTAEGTLQYPTDILEVLSLSKSSSIFSIWVEEPSFSNQTGRVSFSGGVPTPGYSGQNGTVLTVSFRAKRAGTASLSLTDATVRANDGLGTNVLQGAGSLQLTVDSAPTTKPSPAPEVVPQTETASTPAQDIVISSATHPDQNAWYSHQNPELSWTLPANTSAVQTLVSSRKGATPTVLYEPAIAQKQISDLPDGVWYFNIRAMKDSAWGPIHSFALHIDTTAPTIGSPRFSYDSPSGMLSVSAIASDNGSGIASYKITIDGSAPITVSKANFESSAYKLPVHISGNHTVSLAVLDKAGNSAETAGVFSVPSVETPTLEAIPDQMERGDQLSIRGKAGSDNAQVRIYLSKNGNDPDEFLAVPNEAGSFTLLGPVLQNGRYEVWAEGVSRGGIVSTPATKIHTSVGNGAVFNLGPIAVSTTSLLLLALLFSILSLVIAALGWYKVYLYHQSRRHRVLRMQKNVHQAFGKFRDGIQRHIEAIEDADTKRKLTSEKINLKSDVESNLAKLEEYIDEELS